MTVSARALGGALTLVTFAVSFAFSYGPGVLRMSLPGALAVSLGAAAAVWLSGRRPVAALVGVVGLALGLPVLGATFEALDLVVVLVVFRAATDTRLPPWVLGAACLAALTVHDVWQRVAFARPFAEPSVLYPLLLTALTVGLGLQSRQVRVQHAELVELRDADRRRAVSDERRRIARDLHDVAAHHLSALVVRNKLARRVATERALEEAADFTARTAAEALGALRQVVAVLNTDRSPPGRVSWLRRADQGPDPSTGSWPGSGAPAPGRGAFDPELAPLAPQPSLADIEEVVARMEAAGLRIDREPLPVPRAGSEVEVAVVRIVQEALANVLRHRGPGRCWLLLQRRGDAIEVTVDDDGPSTWRPEVADPSWHRPGSYGLLGMRERAEACGGRLAVEPSPRGGWRVSAVLPAPVPVP